MGKALIIFKQNADYTRKSNVILTILKESYVLRYAHSEVSFLKFTSDNSCMKFLSINLVAFQVLVSLFYFSLLDRGYCYNNKIER